jgi:hypothetical protein
MLVSCCQPTTQWCWVQTFWSDGCCSLARLPIMSNAYLHHDRISSSSNCVFHLACRLINNISYSSCNATTQTLTTCRMWVIFCIMFFSANCCDVVLLLFFKYISTFVFCHCYISGYYTMYNFWLLHTVRWVRGSGTLKDMEMFTLSKSYGMVADSEQDQASHTEWRLIRFF